MVLEREFDLTFVLDSLPERLDRAGLDLREPDAGPVAYIIRAAFADITNPAGTTDGP